MRYFVVHFYQKSCHLCACHKSKMDLIPQPQEQKSGRRQTQCSGTLWECLCTWPIWYCCLQPFHMRYFVVHFWSKIMLFVRATALAFKRILFLNHRNRNVAGGNHKVLVYYLNASAPNPSGVVPCNPFKWDILWLKILWLKILLFCVWNNSKMNFIPQPQE